MMKKFAFLLLAVCLTVGTIGCEGAKDAAKKGGDAAKKGVNVAAEKVEEGAKAVKDATSDKKEEGSEGGSSE